MPMSARRQSNMNSLLPVEVPQHFMAVQQRLHALQFDKFTTPSSFFVLEDTIQNQVFSCSDFPSEAML